jgi:hypothetical protein
MLGEMVRPLLAGTDVRRNVSGFFRTESGIARAGMRVLKLAGAAGVVALVAFHVFLLWDRLTGGQMFDPAVALRWVSAAGLIAALVGLRRHGVPLLSGRRALLVWLLVALLHWTTGPPTAASDIPTGDASASLIFVLPSTAATALLGVGLLLATLTTRRARPVLTCSCTVEPCDAGQLSSGWRLLGGARAPPPAAA